MTSQLQLLLEPVRVASYWRGKAAKGPHGGRAESVGIQEQRCVAGCHVAKG